MIKESFEYYLRNIYTKSDGSKLSESSVAHYADESMRFINNIIRKISDYSSIYEIDSVEELLEINQKLLLDESFSSTNKRGNNMYSAALNRYIRYAEGAMFEGKKNLLLDFPEKPKYTVPSQTAESVKRTRIKVLQAEMANHYQCEVNPDHKTFIVATSDHQYCEGHHLIPLAQQRNFDYSLDCFANIVVLCPTCHRMFHYGRTCDIEKHLHRFYDEREEQYCNAGFRLSWTEFKEAASRLYN